MCKLADDDRVSSSVEGKAEEHWAQARREAGLDADGRPSEKTRAELMADELIGILDGENIALLEDRLLPRYLSQRRWFGEKDRSIESLRMVTPATALIDEIGLLAHIEVTIEGSNERYALPLTVVWNEDGHGPDDLGLARDMAITCERGKRLRPTPVPHRRVPWTRQWEQRAGTIGHDLASRFFPILVGPSFGRTVLLPKLVSPVAYKFRQSQLP